MSKIRFLCMLAAILLTMSALNALASCKSVSLFNVGDSCEDSESYVLANQINHRFLFDTVPYMSGFIMNNPTYSLPEQNGPFVHWRTTPGGTLDLLPLLVQWREEDRKLRLEHLPYVISVHFV